MARSSASYSVDRTATEAMVSLRLRKLQAVQLCSLPLGTLDGVREQGVIDLLTFQEHEPTGSYPPLFAAAGDLGVLRAGVIKSLRVGHLGVLRPPCCAHADWKCVGKTCG